MTDWFVTDWTLAMLALTALFTLEASAGRLPAQKLRTWAALLSASALGWLVTPAVGTTPYLAYIAICIAGAIAVLVHPAGTAQRAIGQIFAAMALFHFGALWHGVAGGSPAYWSMLHASGWAQFLILAAWSFFDGFGKAVRFHHHRIGAARHLADAAKGER